MHVNEWSCLVLLFISKLLLISVHSLVSYFIRTLNRRACTCYYLRDVLKEFLQSHSQGCNTFSLSVLRSRHFVLRLIQTGINRIIRIARNLVSGPPHFTVNERAETYENFIFV